MGTATEHGRASNMCIICAEWLPDYGMMYVSGPTPFQLHRHPTERCWVWQSLTGQRNGCDSDTDAAAAALAAIAEACHVVNSIWDWSEVAGASCHDPAAIGIAEVGFIRYMHNLQASSNVCKAQAAKPHGRHQPILVEPISHSDGRWECSTPTTGLHRAFSLPFAAGLGGNAAVHSDGRGGALAHPGRLPHAIWSQARAVYRTVTCAAGYQWARLRTAGKAPMTFHSRAVLSGRIPSETARIPACAQHSLKALGSPCSRNRLLKDCFGNEATGADSPEAALAVAGATHVPCGSHYGKGGSRHAAAVCSHPRADSRSDLGQQPAQQRQPQRRPGMG